MKKILLLLIIIAFPKIINAETYYSNYYESENECTESDTCKIERLKKYNTYSFNYVDMGYLSDNDKYLKDENDFLEEKLDELININTNREQISEINIISMPTNLKIYELEVYYNNELINYTPRINYYIQNSENLSDGNLDTYYTHGNTQTFLILYLDKKYNIKDLTIKIYTKEQDNQNIMLDIGSNIFLNNEKNRWHIISFTNSNSRDIEYDYIKNIKYKYYYIDKFIKNIYEDLNEYSILDDYIIDNHYYIRDKLEIRDNIEINSEIYNIEDYIITATDKVQYDCNIDDYKNGIYTCEFILNDINIKKDVILNIKNNTLENNNKLISVNKDEYINNINNNQYKDKQSLDNYLNNTDNVTNYVSTDNNINNNNNVTTTNLSKEANTKSNKQKNTNVSKNKSNSTKKSKLYIKILISLFLIIIDIILIIKRKRNNVESI